MMAPLPLCRFLLCLLWPLLLELLLPLLELAPELGADGLSLLLEVDCPLLLADVSYKKKNSLEILYINPFQITLFLHNNIIMIKDYLFISIVWKRKSVNKRLFICIRYTCFFGIWLELEVEVEVSPVSGRVVSTSDESCFSVCVKFLLASARALVSNFGFFEGGSPLSELAEVFLL